MCVIYRDKTHFSRQRRADVWNRCVHILVPLDGSLELYGMLVSVFKYIFNMLLLEKNITLMLFLIFTR